MLVTLASALLAAAQPAAPGRDWQDAGESSDGGRKAYDRASIRLDRATMVASFDYRIDGADVQRIAVVEVRCAGRLARVVRTRRYSPAGALLGSDDEPSGWTPIPPDSGFVRVADEACGAVPQPG